MSAVSLLHGQIIAATCACVVQQFVLCWLWRGLQAYKNKCGVHTDTWVLVMRAEQESERAFVRR